MGKNTLLVNSLWRCEATDEARRKVVSVAPDRE